jgi:hypothetical protein
MPIGGAVTMTVLLDDQPRQALVVIGVMMRPALGVRQSMEWSEGPRRMQVGRDRAVGVLYDAPTVEMDVVGRPQAGAQQRQRRRHCEHRLRRHPPSERHRGRVYFHPVRTSCRS